MADCLFCKIAAGEIPSTKVYEDEYVYAFKDIDPQAPFHAVVIPKKHIGSADEIDSSNSIEIARVFFIQVQCIGIVEIGFGVLRVTDAEYFIFARRGAFHRRKR